MKAATFYAEEEMIRKHIFSLVIAVSMLNGFTYGQDGHGTHTPGTIGAVGNNGVGVQGGRDILIGGSGADRSTPAPTGTVTFIVDSAALVVAGIQALLTIR